VIATLRQQPIALVAIGGSAGSIEALVELCPALPAQAAYAVVVLVHLPSERESLLPGLLAPISRMPVVEAAPWEPVAPGHVYIAPNGYHLGIEADHSFSLSNDELVNFARPSIDVLFTSVADVYRHRALAILLTGANADGARGMHRVADAGGLTIVEDPTTARRPEMPQAALDRFTPSAVLSVKDIAVALSALTPLDRTGVQ
jgi:two-component system, chemotaxis family, protein-glutamate methylesterase/glutaminase